MNKIILDYYIDPAHGYLRVPRTLADSLGCVPSRYSFMDAKYYYLEEDEDMPDFLAAYKEATGDEPEHIDHQLDFDVLGSTWIRDLDTVL